MITKMNAVLEIDHERGVIYVHVKDKRDIIDRNIMTALRISGLPRPIPELKGRQLDIGLSVTDDLHPGHPRLLAACDWKDARER